MLCLVGLNIFTFYCIHICRETARFFTQKHFPRWKRNRTRTCRETLLPSKPATLSIVFL